MLQIKTTPSAIKPKILVVIGEPGFERQVSFRMLSINKTRFVDNQENIFKHLNEYWAKMSRSKQEEIFELYLEVSNIFEFCTPSLSVLDANIKPIVKKLLSYHDLDHIRSFITHSNILIPPLAVNYEHSVDNQYTRDRTYILSDYMKLLPLALAIRCIIPIWHEYLLLIASQVGERLKEMFAFYLLEGTPHFSCEAMKKLEMYITETAERTNDENAFVMKALSSDDFSAYLLSDLVVKKLCIGELSSNDPAKHIVSFCYKSLIQRVQPRPTSPEDTIRKKDSTDSGPDDGQERSLWEQYRQRYDLSVGQIEELAYSVRDIDALSEQLGGIPKSLVSSCVNTSKALLVSPPSEAQFMLLKLTLAPVISSRCIMYIEEEHRYKLFGLAQAYLYHNGHKYLSLLVSGHKATSGEELVMSDSDSRMGLRPELVQKLAELYPFVLPKTEMLKDIKQKYWIFTSIDKLLGYTDLYKWKTTAPSSLVETVIGRDTNYLPIIGDIRNEIAQLFIFLGERSLETKSR